MKKIILDKCQLINDEITMPIEINDNGYIIDNEEILFSSKYNIDKNSVDSDLEKVYAYELFPTFEATLDKYRKINLKMRKFKLDKIYLMHNASHFDGGYRFDVFYFTLEGEELVGYYYNLFYDLSKNQTTYYLNRDQLEEIFKIDSLDGYYINNAEVGLKCAFNKKDGIKEMSFTIPTDEEIEASYNERQAFFNRIYHSKLKTESIDEIKDYSITKEILSDQYELILIIDGIIYFATFNISMLKRNEFKCTFTSYTLPNKRNNYIEENDDIIKKILSNNIKRS